MQIEVPEGWSLRRLGDEVTLQVGHAFKSNTFVELGKVRLLRGSNVKRQRIDWSPAITRYLPKKHDSFSVFALKEKDIVVAMDGALVGRSFGMISEEDLPCYLVQRVACIRPKGALDTDFVWQLICRNFAQHADKLKTHTAIPHISPKDIRDFPIPLPPLPEQRKIAAILSSVDEAIAATEQVIEQTRRVKEGLLQELLTRGIGHTRFKQTPIGKIPESWEVKRLGDVIKNGVRNGYSPVSPAEPTGKWVLGLGALSLEGFVLSEIKPAPLNESKVDDFLLEPGDFLMSRSNTPDRVGICAIYRGGLTNCAYPDLMMRFHCDVNRIHPDFLEHWLRGWTARKYIKGAAAGTSQTMVKINSKTVHKTPVLLPPMEEQRQIVLVLSAIDKAIDHGKQRTSRLRQTKAGLLQDLLTGKVRVSV